VLGVYDANISKILANEEIKDIVAAMGLEIGKPTIESIRFSRVVLLADADPDGQHVKSLLVSFFYKFWPTLFDNGVICDLDTPLFISKKGKDKFYIYNKEQYNEYEKEGKLKGAVVSYFKGLAGLESEDWDYFLNKNPRYTPISRTNKTDEMLDIVFGPSSEKRKIWLGQ
jgi:DNA gyrase subunit B